MSVLRFRQEDGSWTGLAALKGDPGRDGAIQYSAGNGINITNDEIALDMDTTPTALSTKPVTSDGIKSYVDNAIQVSGGGDMLRSVYDTNQDGVVDNAELVNGHTVAVDVPANAQFTDTTYEFGTAYNAVTNKAATLADIPTDISAFTNDVGYLTSYTETEPTFIASPAATITAQDIASWNAKQDFIIFNTTYDATTNKAATMSDIPTNTSELSNNSGFLTAESDPIFISSPAYSITTADITSWSNKQDTIAFNTLYNATTNKAATMADIPTNVSAFNNDVGYLTSYTETEPSFNSSAASNITQNDINNWNAKQTALVFNTAYNATSNKVATMADIPTIPTNISSFTNDAGYLTSYTETEPSFNASAAKGITAQDISNWNNKMDSLVFNTAYNATTNKAATMADISGKQDALVFNTAYDATTNKVATMADISGKQDTIVFNTTYDATTNKAATMSDIPSVPTVPTKTSDLTNDNGFITSGGVDGGASSYIYDSSYAHSKTITTNKEALITIDPKTDFNNNYFISAKGKMKSRGASTGKLFAYEADSNAQGKSCIMVKIQLAVHTANNGTIEWPMNIGVPSLCYNNGTSEVDIEDISLNSFYTTKIGENYSYGNGADYPLHTIFERIFYYSISESIHQNYEVYLKNNLTCQCKGDIDSTSYDLEICNLKVIAEAI